MKFVILSLGTCMKNSERFRQRNEFFLRHWEIYFHNQNFVRDLIHKNEYYISRDEKTFRQLKLKVLSTGPFLKLHHSSWFRIIRISNNSHTILARRCKNEREKTLQSKVIEYWQLIQYYPKFLTLHLCRNLLPTGSLRLLATPPKSRVNIFWSFMKV